MRGNKAGRGLSEDGMMSFRKRWRRWAGLGWAGCLLICGAAFAEPGGHAGGEVWIAEVRAGVDAREAAEEMGARYVEPLRGVDGHHRFSFVQRMGSQTLAEAEQRAAIARQLSRDKRIVHFERETLLRRYPRNFVPPDPRFPDQWHLENSGQGGGQVYADVNVRPVWDAGWRGNGVTIAIVDTGTDIDHPDLAANYEAGTGYDYIDDDSDARPSGSEDNHGTAVAGISLAASNEAYGLGIAPGASLVPLRLIPGPYDRGDEAEALSHRKQQIHIYNNSWGPADNGAPRYDDASETLKRALARNVEEGRGGLGNIYVWAAGNGGQSSDNSNYDGYNALPYTISVGAVGDRDTRASYSEPGANLLVVAPSQGGGGSGIITTDRTSEAGYTDGDMTDSFNGTSAAAPMVAGVVALLLEAYPELDWRSVQQILARSAEPVDFREEVWQQNGAGLWTSHDYGFGRVDAQAALALAAQWPEPGPLITRSWTESVFADIPELGDPLEVRFPVAEELEVQFVRLRVSADHDNWGHLRVELVSPQGTRSLLAEAHPSGNESGQPGSWTYLSTSHLGEAAMGEWIVRVADEEAETRGRLGSVKLTLMGGEPNGNRPPRGEPLEIFTNRFPVDLDLLEDVTDADGDALEVIALQPPPGGVVEDLGSGRYRYDQVDSEDGRDSFSVLVSDGRGGTLRRMVRILDPRPVARNDLFPVQAGSQWDLPVLQNDRDLDQDELRITGFEAPEALTVTNPNGRVLRAAVAEELAGTYRIQYFITDDSDGSSAAWATLVVGGPEQTVALDFDGVDDFLRVAPTEPDLPLRDRFSVEAVIHPEDWGEHVTGFGRILQRGYLVFFLNGNGHGFYNDRSLVAFFKLTDGNDFRQLAANSAAGTLELGRDQHVVMTFDSSDPSGPVRFYVDGESVPVEYPEDVGRPESGWTVIRNAQEELYSGESGNGQRAFHGRIQGLRIWERVLSAGEVGAYAEGREPAVQPALFFPLDQTLAMKARSTGSLVLEAEISGARRVPAEVPWQGLEERFLLGRDEGNGWWQEQVLGRIYGDAFPWVYVADLGWVYAAQETAASGYYLHRAEGSGGWLYTRRLWFPWWVRLPEKEWLYYEADAAAGRRYYEVSSGEWLGVDDFAVPGGTE